MASQSFQVENEDTARRRVTPVDQPFGFVFSN